ncbi:tRNA pseudouridine synthase D [Ramicandelaber brevisporus]|nr:tRNA pseudouridine synthase D [Ramicandelaber brevisporus]
MTNDANQADQLPGSNVADTVDTADTGAVAVKRARISSSGAAKPTSVAASSRANNTADADNDDDSQKQQQQQQVMAVKRTEADVGIIEYVFMPNSDSESDVALKCNGFDALVKHRFSDFIVREITLDGEVVELSTDDADGKCDELPQLPTVASAAIAQSEIGRNDGKDGEEEEVSIEVKMKTMLTEVIGKERAEWLVSTIMQMIPKQNNEDDGNASEPQQAASIKIEWSDELSKDARTKIHQTVKELARGKLVSETVDGKIEIGQSNSSVSSRNQRGGGRGGSSRGGGGRDRDRRNNNSNSGEIDWKAAGGDYIQFVLRKENRETVDALNQVARFLKLKTNVFSFAGTKDRRGITTQLIRAFRVDPKRLLTLAKSKAVYGVSMGRFTLANEPLRLGDLKGNRFTVILRDVKPQPPANIKDIEQLLQGMQERGFANYYGMQRFGTSSVGTHEVGKALLQSNWKDSVALLLEPREDDYGAIRNAREVWKSTRNASKALPFFPRMCVAETSILGMISKDSTAAASNGREFGNWLGAINSIPRNLKLMYVHAYQSIVWNKTVSMRAKKYGWDKVVLGDIVLPRGLNDSTSTEEQDETANDSQEQQQSQQLSRNKLASTAIVVTADNIAQYTIDDVVIPLVGYDVKYPENDTGDYMRSLLKEDGLDADAMERPQKDFSLSGSYRRILGRAKDLSWQFVHYDDPNVDIDSNTGDSGEGDSNDKGEGRYVALVTDFKLDTSSYATMALREIIRRDTSKSAMTRDSMQAHN